MKIHIDFKPLLRTKGQSIFQYRKDGLYQLIRCEWINIELEDRDMVIDGLTNMYDNETSQSVRFDIQEVIDYLKDSQ